MQFLAVSTSPPQLMDIDIIMITPSNTPRTKPADFGLKNPEPTPAFSAYLQARIVASAAIAKEQAAFEACFKFVCAKKELPMDQIVKIPCSQFNIRIGERFQTQHSIYVRIA